LFTKKKGKKEKGGKGGTERWKKQSPPDGTFSVVMPTSCQPGVVFARVELVIASTFALNQDRYGVG
jgi:hypothetical protein